jgi:hypothetical protein
VKNKIIENKIKIKREVFILFNDGMLFICVNNNKIVKVNNSKINPLENVPKIEKNINENIK